MTPQDRKNFARKLFIETTKTQKEICAMLELSTPQMSKWVNDEGWKTLRTAQQVTKKSLALRTLTQINKIHEEADAQERILTPAETDQLSKLFAQLRDLDQNADLATYSSVLDELLDYLKDMEVPELPRIGELQLEFLAFKAKELSKPKIKK